MDKPTLNYLPRDREKTISLADRWIVRVGYGILLVCLFGVLTHLYLDSKTKAHVALDPENWRALIPWTDGNCDINVPNASTCMASINRKELWSSNFFRGTDEYYNKLRFNQGNQYWLGAIIPVEKLQVAAHESANTFVIGSVFGTVDIWLDGIYQTRTDYIQQDLPLHVIIPQERLNSPRPLFIALRITPNPHFSTPERKDYYNSDGFFTRLETERIMRRSMFTGITRHLVILALFLFLARFLMNAAARDASSYDFIVGAQFTLLLGTISLLATHLLTPFLTVPGFYRFFFLLLFWEGYFVIRLTLAFLRVRREISARSTYALIVLSLGLSFVSPFWIESVGLSYLTSIFLPSIYGACALFVGWRAHRISQSPGKASQLRVNFLFSQFFCLGIIAICYFIESRNFPATEVYWSRALNFIVVYFLIRQLDSGTMKEGAHPI